MAPVRKKPSFNERAAQAQSDSYEVSKAGALQTVESATNSGDTLMAMALRFEELAYENRINLKGRGAPYMAKVFRTPVEKSGMLSKTYKDGDGNLVPLPKVGRTVVKYFWSKMDWDYDGDPISQFADPVMFEYVLARVEERWLNRRIHNRLVREGKVAADNRG